MSPIVSFLYALYGVGIFLAVVVTYAVIRDVLRELRDRRP
jgi:hypothetical protein